MPLLQNPAQLGEKIERLSLIGLYVAIAIIYSWFGGMKFTNYEAEGLVPLVSNSPLLAWMYEIWDIYTFSELLGVLELLIAALVLGRVISPKLSALGGLLSMGLFVTTVSFMATVPGVFEPAAGGFPAISVLPGQFLLKDVGLFMASAFILGNSLKAMRQ